MSAAIGIGRYSVHTSYCVRARSHASKGTSVNVHVRTDPVRYHPQLGLRLNSTSEQPVILLGPYYEDTAESYAVHHGDEPCATLRSIMLGHAGMVHVHRHCTVCSSAIRFYHPGLSLFKVVDRSYLLQPFLFFTASRVWLVTWRQRAHRLRSGRSDRARGGARVHEGRSAPSLVRSGGWLSGAELAACWCGAVHCWPEPRRRRRPRAAHRAARPPRSPVVKILLPLRAPAGSGDQR